MKKNELINQLKMFIIPHPIFIDSEEEIFTPKEGLIIKLWIEGGFEIKLIHKESEINFNSMKRDILIIAEREKFKILRLQTKRIIAFELLKGDNFHDDLNFLFQIDDHRKN